MSLYNKHIEILQGLESVFGFNPAQVQQGSAEWHVMRLGVATASRAKDIVAGKDTEGRASYLAELAAEIVNCSSAESSPFKQTEWGKLHESAARDLLGVELDFTRIDEMPIIYMDSNLRVAVSPDGVSGNTIYEIKSPFDATNHIKHMAFGRVKSEWQWQRQMQMLVSGAEAHIFCTYDPRAVLAKNLHYVVTELDDKKQATLRDAIPAFLHDLDAALASIGVKFGDHFAYLKSLRAG